MRATILQALCDSVARRAGLAVFGVILMLVVLALAPKPAQTATLTVTKNADTADGACDADCSLREAIIAANAAAGSDTVKVPAGTYTLALGTAGEDAAAGGDLDVTSGDRLTIRGARAAGTIVQAGTTAFGGIDRVFDVRPGASARISGVTIRNGNVAGAAEDGGGIRNFGSLRLSKVVVSGSQSVGGGGVDTSFANLTVTNSTISGNRTVTFGVRNFGGGVFVNGGQATISRSTISNNDAEGGGGGMAIFNAATVTVTNSTVSGNIARDAQPSQFPGGGGINNNIGTLTLTNATVTGNRAASGAGIKNDDTSNPLTVRNTIVANNLTLAGNAAANCAGTLTSRGHNLDSGTSCGFTKTGDLRNADPKLGTLANNGGPTPTHGLLRGSPAINAASNAACPATDQRGVSRPQGSRCDIGAFELKARRSQHGGSASS